MKGTQVTGEIAKEV
jgi:hypothetical protein